MKPLAVELPEHLGAQVEMLVQNGHYRDAQEVVIYALREFLRSNAAELAQRHQRQDISWALRESGIE